MKRLKLIPLLLCTVVLMIASGCSSSDDNSTPATPVINIVKNGSWKVTSFIDSGNDETAHFTGYSFTFAAPNVLRATNGTATHTGVWSVTRDDSDDDDSISDDLDFNILFNSLSLPADFSELNEDWEIVSYSSTTISLIHISGGGGGTDTLVFTKI